MGDMDNTTNIKVVGFGPNDNAIAPCSKNYTTVRYDNPLDGQKADIARLFLSKKRLYVLCYAMSPLINPGKLFTNIDDMPFHSGTFLKSIVLDESLAIPDRATLGDGKDGLGA